MFRGNEASKVGEVLAKQHAGDRDGMIVAARELWLSPRERDDGLDDACRDAWSAIEATGATALAVAAALEAIRGKRQLRAHAFIDIVENIQDQATLFELADIVLASGWPAYPYLASIFLWLVDNHHEDALWKFIQANRTRITATAPGWTLGAYILTATRIGNRHDVAAWFGSFEKYTDVPMWAIAAHAASVTMLADHAAADLGAVATAGLARCARDATHLFLDVIAFGELLRTDQTDAFVARYAARDAGQFPSATMAHPMTRYANGAKHRHQVIEKDFEFSIDAIHATVGGPTLTSLATAQSQRPVNWRLITHVKEHDTIIRRGMRLLPIFIEMFGLTKGDPRALELYVEMRKQHPKDLPHLVAPWERLVRRRIGWFRRKRLEFF